MSNPIWESLSSATGETFSISELAQEFAVTSRTIRFYEDKGLLSPVRKGQRRIYSKRERVRLHIILRAKRMGISLSDISGFLDLYDADDGEKKQTRILLLKIRERLDVLESQRADIEATIEEMQQIGRNVERQLAETAAELDEPTEPGLIGFGVAPTNANPID
jgi:DNA-binding transcriptional MerR regulator